VNRHGLQGAKVVKFELREELHGFCYFSQHVGTAKNNTN